MIILITLTNNKKDNHNNFNLTVFTQDGQVINALESKVKHAQCFDVGLMDDGSIVLASKDYRVYVYRYNSTSNNNETNTGTGTPFSVNNSHQLTNINSSVSGSSSGNNTTSTASNNNNLISSLTDFSF
jgi:hypothetical protein